jgi:hypothetical protein
MLPHCRGARSPALVKQESGSCGPLLRLARQSAGEHCKIPSNDGEGELVDSSLVHFLLRVDRWRYSITDLLAFVVMFATPGRPLSGRLADGAGVSCSRRRLLRSLRRNEYGTTVVNLGEANWQPI